MGLFSGSKNSSQRESETFHPSGWVLFCCQKRRPKYWFQFQSIIIEPAPTDGSLLWKCFAQHFTIFLALPFSPQVWKIEKECFAWGTELSVGADKELHVRFCSMITTSIFLSMLSQKLSVQRFGVDPDGVLDPHHPAPQRDRRLSSSGFQMTGCSHHPTQIFSLPSEPFFQISFPSPPPFFFMKTCKETAFCCLQVSTCTFLWTFWSPQLHVLAPYSGRRRSLLTPKLLFCI